MKKRFCYDDGSVRNPNLTPQTNIPPQQINYGALVFVRGESVNGYQLQKQYGRADNDEFQNKLAIHVLDCIQTESIGTDGLGEISYISP
jgi:hypothetical protein